MKVVRLVVLGLLLGTTVFAQSPTDPEVRAKFAEQQLKVERARVDAAKRTINSLEREIAIKTAVFLKNKEESERQAALDRAKIAALNVSLTTTKEELQAEQIRVAELQCQVAELTKQRDKARSWKISFLRVFGIKRN